MRQFREFEAEAVARQWADVLWSHGIECTVRPSSDATHGVWIYDERQLEQAESLYSVLHDSDPAALEGLAATGRERHEQMEHDRADRHPQIIDVRARFARRRSVGRVSLALILVSVGVGVVTELGKNMSTVRYFTIGDFTIEGQALLFAPGLTSIGHGEFWRLISPIFVHFGVTHLVFNLWWLKDLGTAVERVFSSVYLLALVLFVGVTSNLAQYWWSGSPLFGGMSGVVYGLFGFLWMRGRLDPSCPVGVPNGTALILLLWYVACVAGVIPNVANVAHTDGLVVGVAWGVLSSGYLTRKPRS